MHCIIYIKPPFGILVLSIVALENFLHEWANLIWLPLANLEPLQCDIDVMLCISEMKELTC